MSDIYHRIRTRREELGLSQKELALRMGYRSKSSINKIEMGINDIPQSKVIAFARALETTAAYLMGVDEARKPVVIPPGFSPIPNMDTIPVVGQIACGEPITAEENIEGYASTPELWKADFALICRGRSMEPKIMDGDLVAIRSDIQVETGQIAAVRIGDEATLKKIYYYPERIILRPINDEFEEQVFEGEEMNEITIEGKAVGLCRGI